MSSAAEASDRHVGRYGAQLTAGLIAVAGVPSGQRTLDVGCGPAPLTRSLADVVGAENVAAVDRSEPFAEACRARVPGADARVGVGEQLPFAADDFGRGPRAGRPATVLRSDLYRRLGSSRGAFRLTARVWWARGSAS